MPHTVNAAMAEIKGLQLPLNEFRSGLISQIAPHVICTYTDSGYKPDDSSTWMTWETYMDTLGGREFHTHRITDEHIGIMEAQRNPGLNGARLFNLTEDLMQKLNAVGFAASMFAPDTTGFDIEEPENYTWEVDIDAALVDVLVDAVATARCVLREMYQIDGGRDTARFVAGVLDALVESVQAEIEQQGAFSAVETADHLIETAINQKQASISC